MEIKVDDITQPVVLALLQEHMNDMVATSPPESRHVLDLSGLRDPSVTFWCAWDHSELMGCGALKQLSTTVGEIKSMRTARHYLRQGVAAGMLQHIVADAKNRGYQQLYLETGSMDFFKPARQLYRQFGFQDCPPFAQYKEDPNSVFMLMAL